MNKKYYFFGQPKKPTKKQNKQKIIIKEGEVNKQLANRKYKRDTHFGLKAVIIVLWALGLGIKVISRPQTMYSKFFGETCYFSSVTCINQTDSWCPLKRQHQHLICNLCFSQHNKREDKNQEQKIFHAGLVDERKQDEKVSK